MKRGFPYGSQSFLVLELGGFTGQLAGATDGLGLLACLLFGGLLVVVAQLHLAEDAFALEALLENPEGLVDIVVADLYLQNVS